MSEYFQFTLLSIDSLFQYFTYSLKSFSFNIIQWDDEKNVYFERLCLKLKEAMLATCLV